MGKCPAEKDPRRYIDGLSMGIMAAGSMIGMAAGSGGGGATMTGSTGTTVGMGCTTGTG